jgi:hypothetical protein
MGLLFHLAAAGSVAVDLRSALPQQRALNGGSLSDSIPASPEIDEAKVCYSAPPRLIAGCHISYHCLLTFDLCLTLHHFRSFILPFIFITEGGPLSYISFFCQHFLYVNVFI